MESEPTLETVYQAIDTLYSSADASAPGMAKAKASASMWLEELQKSVFAWKITDQLLANRRDQVSCYFGAQTMHHKIRSHFHELPEGSYGSLKDSLINHLCNYPASRLQSEPQAFVILTQLCLGLVDLYLQVPNWKGLILELFQRFGNDADHVPLMLIILRVFPEEFESENLRLGAIRRQQVSEECDQQLPNVIDFLSRVCQQYSNDIDTICRAFTCLSSWLRDTNCSTKALAESQLLVSILQLLRNDHAPTSLHESATECVGAALRRIEDPKNHLELSTLLHSAINEFQTPFQTCVAREDLDNLQNYARLFTELAEAMMPAIIDTPGMALGDLNTVDLLLLVVGHHDYSLAQMTFNVWYRLSEFIYQSSSDWLQEIFKPYIERLIIALCRHCRYDSDMVGVPNEKDDFVEFRLGVTECLKDVVFIVGTEHCVKMMFGLLSAQSASSTWDETEAALYVLLSVARNIISTEHEIVPQVIGAVMQLDGNIHVGVRLTAVRLMGELADWISDNSDYLEPIVNWLVSCMSDHALSKAAAQSIERLCEVNKQKMYPFFDKIAACALHLDNQKSDEEAVQALLRAASVLLMTQPSENIGTKIEMLCEPAINKLDQILRSVSSTSNGINGGGSDSDKENPKPDQAGSSSMPSGNPVVPLDRLAAVFRNLGNFADNNGKSRPWLNVVEKLWPLLLGTLRTFDTQVSVTEHCVRSVRFAIRSLGVQSCPFVEPLLVQMIDIYNRVQHSCFLYLGSILVDEYGQFPQLIPPLVHMLEAFSTPTFKMFEAPLGLRNHPDSIDDYFRMCLRFVQRAPSAFFQCPLTQSIWQCGMAALVVDHKEACKSVTKFFSELVDSLLQAKKMNVTDPGVQAAESQLAQYGAALVSACMNASIFCLSRANVREVAEIIFVLTKFSPEHMSVWLKDALAQIPNRGGTCATEPQLAEFHSTIVKANDVRLVGSAMRELCRLYK